MYAVEPDPYCYPDSDVLINLPGLRSAAQLEAFELIATTQRADEAFPAGRFGVSHYRRFHRHLFQDVYAWAGKFRTVRLAKGASMFCYPEHIPAEMDRLFDRLKREDFLRGRSRADFARGLAAWLASINAIHPFREGNGRTQLSFAAMLAEKAGWPFNLDHLDHETYLAAIIASFAGDEQRLVGEVDRLL